MGEAWNGVVAMVCHLAFHLLLLPTALDLLSAFRIRLISRKSTSNLALFFSSPLPYGSGYNLSTRILLSLECSSLGEEVVGNALLVQYSLPVRPRLFSVTLQCSLALSLSISLFFFAFLFAFVLGAREKRRVPWKEGEGPRESPPTQTNVPRALPEVG